MRPGWQYAQHAREVARRFDVRMIEDSGMKKDHAFAVPVHRFPAGHIERQKVGGDWKGAVVHAPIEDDTSYAVAMHEMGHILSATGYMYHEKKGVDPKEAYKYTLLEERSAWEWAAHYAIEWTAGMEAVKVWALGTYENPQLPDFGGLFGILDQMFGANGGPMDTIFGGGGSGPQLPEPPKPDPEAGKRMAPKHAQTAQSIIGSIKGGR